MNSVFSAYHMQWHRYVLLALAVAAISGGLIVGGGCGGPMSPVPTPDPSNDDADAVAVAREIEEADIVKLDSGYLYLTNPYTGLRIIDVQTIEQPRMLGGMPLGGRGVEMFVRDDYAFVFTTADFEYCAGEPVGFDADVFENVAQPDFSGSRLWVIDVSDKSQPTLVTTVSFSEFLVATRRVGDVIYTAGNIGASIGVISINISDPGNSFVVESKRFSGDSLDIHVSSTAIYTFGNDPTLSETTLVTYIDIADPEGQIVLRDQFRVPGRVENRFFIDEFAGTFRIATEEFDLDTFTTVVALYTYDVNNPDRIERLSRLPLVNNESLRAVRFDGERGYAVTFRAIDPLFVLDLSNPANPQIAGELEVPGFSTHLVPLGDRLVGVGFADAGGVRPAVSLYDVSDPTNPRVLSRITLGIENDLGLTSEATVDEKALRVIEDAGLIMLPFARFDEEELRWVDFLQLISLDPTQLRERGAIEHRGLVRRSNLLDTRVWILSDLAFQVIDIDDLSEPKSIETIDIITDQELLDAGLAGCADSARFRGTDLFFFPFSEGVFFGCGAFSPGLLAIASLGLLSLRRRK